MDRVLSEVVRCMHGRGAVILIFSKAVCRTRSSVLVTLHKADSQVTSESLFRLIFNISRSSD